MKKFCALSAALFITCLLSVALAESGSLKHTLAAKLAAEGYEAYLKKKGIDPSELCTHSIGQSHIDAAWRWRIRQTKEKVYKTFSNAIKNMEKYPNFVFAGSSPQYYEWLRQDHPKLFRQIVEKEKQGQWEIVGGMWVEPDCNMPDGESFIRQRLLGQRFYLEHFGHTSRVGWLLDSFGYTVNLPQLMKKSGADYLWTTKLVWNDTTDFPFHNFHWRSPDGSEVLTNIIHHSFYPIYFPIMEFRNYMNTRRFLKPGRSLVADYSTSKEKIESVLSDEKSKEVGIFYGWGDGGHGPKEVEVRIQKELAERGYTHFSAGEEYFRHIERSAGRYPVWTDELYLEFHRGTFTTQAWVKRANRKYERAIEDTEVLRSILHVMGHTYPYEELKETWKLVLLQQFHDILPGSSVSEVYEDSRDDYAEIDNKLNRITADGLRKMSSLIDTRPPASGTRPVVVFNPLSWAGEGMVKVEAPKGNAWRVMNAEGELFSSRCIEEKEKRYVQFVARDVPPVGYRVYYLKLKSTYKEKSEDFPSVSETKDRIMLENRFLRLAIDKRSGLITSLVDKRTGVETISAPSGKLLAFRDRDLLFPAWNIEDDYFEQPIELPSPTGVEITCDDPLVVEILFKRKLKKDGGITTFEQRYRLVKGRPLVYIDVDSDFNLHNALVKMEFNTPFDSESVVADGPYVAVERPTHPKTAAAKARWEMTCQKWIDISGLKGGLALLNRGKYGFSLTPDGKGYRLSLIKSAHYPRGSTNAKNVKHLRWNRLPTDFTDQGAHRIRLALMPHEGDWRDAQLWRAGYEFNTPFIANKTDVHKGRLPREHSFVSVDSESVYLTSLKRAEDDDALVLRLVETKGQSDTAQLRFNGGLGIRSAEETDMLELNPRLLNVEDDMLEVSFGPHEIKTVKARVVQE